MKIDIKVKKEFDITTIIVSANIRYSEDGELNGQEDVDGNMPCFNKETRKWNLCIDVDSGRITNWVKGNTANVNYKVCDECKIEIFDIDSNLIYSKEDYVPFFLGDDGYGDYIVMKIDESGYIKDWSTSSVAEFINIYVNNK